jgi:hypothetical protein
MRESAEQESRWFFLKAPDSRRPGGVVRRFRGRVGDCAVTGGPAAMIGQHSASL